MIWLERKPPLSVVAVPPDGHFACSEARTFRSSPASSEHPVTGERDKSNDTFRSVSIDKRDGRGRTESYSYGTFDIALQVEYVDGKKVGESYYVKRKLVSRERYEKARTAYPRMPAADPSLDDWASKLLKDAAGERRAAPARQQPYVPNEKSARRLDAFCAQLVEKPGSKDAVAWIAQSTSTLGELSRRASRRLVSTLVERGAVRVFACEIDVERGLENTGHLVVELPDDVSARRAILKIAARWARKLGFDPTPDDGQRMVYIKLD